MKKRAFLAATALLSSSIILTPAYAAFPDGTADVDGEAPAGITEAAAQAVCDTLASNHGANWTGTLDPASIEGLITSGPTADGDRDIDEESVSGHSGQVPQQVLVHGDPFRIGGSVNMFGFASVVAAHWNDSEYDFTAPYIWQSTYTFDCEMAELVPVGLHNWTGPVQAGDPAKENCEGDRNPHEFDDRGANCQWTQTGTEAQDRGTEQGTIGPVDEGDTLSGHENHGGPVPVDEDEIDLPDVQVVVCISPNTSSKKTLPGSGWAAKNGYDGSKCTTEWYNGGATNQPSPYDNLNTGSNNVVTIPTT